MLLYYFTDESAARHVVRDRANEVQRASVRERPDVVLAATVGRICSTQPAAMHDPHHAHQPGHGML